MRSKNRTKSFAAISVMLMLAICFIPVAEEVNADSETRLGLYGIGDNTKHQLGVETTGTSTGTPVLISSSLISKIVCSDDTTFFLTMDGKLYGMGANNYGQQGDGTTTDVATPKQIGSNLGMIKDVVCSTDTTFFITSDGKLYGMGRNNYGQQGDRTTTDVATPKQIGIMVNEEFTPFTNVSSIVCSAETTFFITSDGKLYGMGRNNYGQQGAGDASVVNTPEQIGSDLDTVIDVVCSTDTTFFITSTYKLYGMGRNNYGQQGDGTTTDVTTPKQIYSSPSKPIFKVSCSTETTFFLADVNNENPQEGRLFGMGHNNYGQVNSTSATDITSPSGSDSSLGYSMTVIVCTTDFTIAADNAGTVVGMGRNDYGQLGSGYTTHGSLKHLSIEAFRSVMASDSTVFYTSRSSDQIYGVGKNDYGWLGTSNDNESQPVQISALGSSTKLIACSSKTVFFYSDDPHISLDNGAGTSNIVKANFFYDSSGLIYRDADNEQCNPFVAPSGTDLVFAGYYTGPTGGVKIIDESGNLVAGVTNYTGEYGEWIYKEAQESLILFAVYEIGFTATVENKSYDGTGPSISVTSQGNDLDSEHYSITYYGSEAHRSAGTNALDPSVVKNVNTYFIRVAGIGSFNDVQRDLQCTISAHDLTVTAGNGSIVKTYDGNNTAGIELFDIGTTDDSVLKMDGLANTEMPVISEIIAVFNSSDTDADTVTVTSITLTDSATNATGFNISNYSLVLGTGSELVIQKTDSRNVGIIKLDPVIISAPTTANIKYDGSAHDMIVTEGTAASGTFLYAISSTNSSEGLTFYVIGETELKRTDLGTYYVFYKVTGQGAEYNDDKIFGPLNASITSAQGGSGQNSSGSSSSPSRNSYTPPNPNINMPTQGGTPMSDKQVNDVVDKIKRVAQSGNSPQIRMSSDSPITVPEAIVDALSETDGSLSFTENGVTIIFTAEVLEDLESEGDIVLSIEKREPRGSETEHVKNGTVYDITLIVNGEVFDGLFKDMVSVMIEYEVPANTMVDSIRVLYISAGKPVQILEHTYHNNIIIFRAAHFSLYAVEYDIGSTVSVDLNGGKPASPGKGWIYDDGRYVKMFAMGTAVDEILDDLGPVSKDLSINTGVHSTSAILTEDTMTIEFEWCSMLILFLIAFIAVFAIALAAVMLKHRSHP